MFQIIIIKITNVMNPAITINEWEAVMQESFPKLIEPAKLSLAVQVQNQIKDIVNPFALVLIGSPSTGKTLTLDITTDTDEYAYCTDDFTVDSFVSHSSNVSKDELEDMDLLPRIKGKTLFVKEMNTIFRKSYEKLEAELGTLTRILDGEGLTRDSGVHGSRGYSGDYSFMMLGACTPFKQKLWEIIGNMGARMFFMKLEENEMNEDEVVTALLSPNFKEQKAEVKKTSQMLLSSIRGKYPEKVVWNKSNDRVHLKKIVTLSKVFAKLRAVLKRSEDGEVHIAKEGEMRIANLIYNFTRGYALIHGREFINEEDIKVAQKLVINSAPPYRSIIVNRALQNTDETVTIQQAADALEKSNETARRTIRDLVDLEILVKVERACAPQNESETYKLVDSLK